MSSSKEISTIKGKESMFSRGRHGARTVEAFGPFPSPARRPSLQSYIQSRLFGLLYGSSIFLSMEQRLRRQGPLLRRVEIRASPLNSLGLRLDPQASVELYRVSNAARSDHTCAHIFSR